MGAEETRKLHAALQTLKDSVPSAERADFFEEVVFQIESDSNGTWRADRMTADDGAIVFLGRQGEVVVFTDDGRILKGKMGSWRTTGKGITLDYERLVSI